LNPRIYLGLRSPPLGGLVLPVVFAFLVAAVLIAPAMEDPGTVGLDDDGVVGGHEHDEEFEDIESPLARAIYSAGDLYCHQRGSRSLRLNGNQMPVCARDLGIFIGLVLGASLGAVVGRRARWPLLLLCLLPMAVDGGLQAATSYESANWLRILTGTVAGTGIGWVLNRAAILISRPRARPQ